MEKTLSSNLLHRGRHFDFLQDEVELPNGSKTKSVVRHPGAVAIVPILSDGRIVLVRQYRYAAGKTLLEIPAGTLEPGEDPLECAMRELREETGFEAGEMEGILSCFMAKEVGAEMEPDESIENEVLVLEEILKKIRENAIEDAKTIVGILALSSVMGV
jgi:ADP-ribose pyrophosphatase